jgi:hypothetical protein
MSTYCAGSEGKGLTDVRQANRRTTLHDRGQRTLILLLNIYLIKLYKKMVFGADRRFIRQERRVIRAGDRSL